MPEAKEPVILSPEKIPQHADDTDVLVDKIIGMVKGYSPNANTDMIYVAYKLAKICSQSPIPPQRCTVYRAPCSACIYCGTAFA